MTDWVPDEETLSEDVKLRISPAMKRAIAAAAAAWPRLPGQRPITSAEWIRITVAKALAK